MSHVWLCVPSARPDGGTLHQWKRMGYNLAIWRDPGAPALPFPVECLRDAQYPGYAIAVNALVKAVLAMDPDCQFVVSGGDDVEPDLNHSPEDIVGQCVDHFRGTFGIMQPTGHAWGESESWAIRKYPLGRRRYIERICGSPFLGREWCQRGHQGAGPLYPGFYHMHVDEALQEVAEHLGILWQRPDLIHLHRHWGLEGDRAKMPDFLQHVNSPEHWRESKAILDRLRAQGFSECLPLQ